MLLLTPRSQAIVAIQQKPFAQADGTASIHQEYRYSQENLPLKSTKLRLMPSHIRFAVDEHRMRV
ncbi:hypothetical protein I8752_08505 [Nostocaceae cyanobacterium CENA369]|uniref:Uncharacterized protein n=1 Tax=Dendronalium phyllosphericum CENA369 TaxID=1725256 RepID=A0A8J7LGJ8_9NOST|nr:hypothetical protein [Dendronalium phyllosphericum]MBH8573054.1 hypothetical protein [Dendronalium phyllosphericum CENA369]